MAVRKSSWSAVLSATSRKGNLWNVIVKPGCMETGRFLGFTKPDSWSCHGVLPSILRRYGNFREVCL
ncbi:hypothetical protein CEXT_779101 [Caerostris extrusa]|uniref:Uncharacterized protein n=1 Tax=Caerostris extrusa TaxID=172846 RepID=A0AAV4NWK8_CAEEX|nr:hypothetical protein CEXT_779101 [Caerostris extrusa]